MAHMYSNAENPRRYFKDSSQLNNCILDSGATFHMTLDISDFVLGSLSETDKYIKILNGIFVTERNRMSSNENA